MDSRTSNAPTPQHVIILAHPAEGSFNHAIAKRYCSTVRSCGQHVVVRDLYKLGFDPRLYADHRPGLDTNSVSSDVAGELGLLRAADAIVLVYPIWFGMPPAMIKGYVDRVLGYAVTPHDISGHMPDQALLGRQLATFSTSALSSVWLDNNGQMESLEKTFDAYLRRIFGMVDAGHTHFAEIVDGMSQQTVATILDAVEAKATLVCSAILAQRIENQSRPLRGADLE